MTMLSFPTIGLSSSASTAGASISNSDIIGIITAFFGLLTVIAAVVALVYAKKSAQSAADAVTPLTNISADMKKTLEEARRLRLVEFLSRRTSILEGIVETIATMLWIPTEIEGSQFTGDPLELFDYRFNQERRKLIIALKVLQNIELPKCRHVADIGHFQDALPELKPAGAEADQALTTALIKLEEEARRAQEGTLLAGSQSAFLLDRLRQREPAFLERLVLSLLMDTDYGRAAAHLRKVGDGGLDGAIHRDPLERVRLYVQANRYEVSTAVGQPEIQEFAEALHEARADGGIFITTSHFTPAAIVYANKLAVRVVLIDSLTLSDLIVHHNIKCLDQQA